MPPQAVTSASGVSLPWAGKTDDGQAPDGLLLHPLILEVRRPFIQPLGPGGGGGGPGYQGCTEANRGVLML